MVNKTTLYSSSLINTLFELNKKNPAHVLIEDKGIKYTVEQVCEQALKLAKGMQNMGVRPGENIVFAMPPGFMMISYLLAATLNNACVVLIDPEMGNDNFKSKLQQLKPRFAVVDKRLILLQEHILLQIIAAYFKKSLPRFIHIPGITYFCDDRILPLMKKTISASNLKRLANKNDVSTEWLDADAESNAFIVYTSGTTAVPKGVVHSLQSFIASINALSKQMDLKGLRVGASLPHFIFLAIAASACAVVMPEMKTGKQKFDFINEKNIEVLFGPPSDFNSVIDFCSTQFLCLSPKLKYLLLGSAPVHPPFLKRLIACADAATEIRCVYGMTENLLTAICDGRVKANDGKGADRLGCFIDGVEYRIAEDGELFIKGQQLFKRYYHLKERGEYHATGDLVKMEGNTLYLTGRKKNMIIRRNFNIYPELYEHTVMKIDGIKEALMLGVYSDEINDEKVYLLLEGENDAETVMKQLRNGTYSIDSEALPDKIIFGKIPHSGRQRKADRKAALKQLIDI